MNTVVVAQSLEELEPFRSQWDELALKIGRPYAMTAWTWAWWRHSAPNGARLQTILVTHGGNLIGVAPFFADRRLGVRRLRLLGAGTSARVDMLAEAGQERAVAEGVVRALTETLVPPDVILFEGTPSESPFPQLLANRWPGRRSPHLATDVSMPAPVLHLNHEDFDAWFAAKGSHFRARIRRGFRKLEAIDGRIRLSENEEDLDRDLQAFADLHHARWRTRGRSGVLTTGVEKSLRDMAHEAVADGRLRVWVLDVAGRIISVQLFLALGGEVAYWLGGFEEGPSVLRPGPAILTVVKAIEHAYSVGDERLDLGSGSQPYKYEFADSEDQLEWSSVTLRTLRYPLARTMLLPMRARQAVATRLSPRFKKHIRDLRRRIPRR